MLRVRKTMLFVLPLIIAAACNKTSDDQASQTADATQGAQSAAATPAAPAAACWTRAQGDDLAERASPFDSTTVQLDAGVVKVCYSRPSKRGRTVMGSLVPFDQPWRLGANEATAIHVPTNGTIAGVDVAPGVYSLYTVPTAKEWRIVVNGTAQRWGIPIDSGVQATDVGSGAVPVSQTDNDVEQLTMHLERASADSANLVVEWEKTAVVVPVVLR